MVASADIKDRQALGQDNKWKTSWWMPERCGGTKSRERMTPPRVWTFFVVSHHHNTSLVDDDVMQLCSCVGTVSYSYVMFISTSGD